MPYQMCRRLSLAAAWTLLLLTLLPASYAPAGRRPAPLMDFVSQEAGVYDTYHTCLNEDGCRLCHSYSTADRHHYSRTGMLTDCTLCHETGPPPDYGVVFRNCLLSQCHAPLNGSPHHATSQALAMECTRCHNPQLVGELGAPPDPAQGDPQVGVPTPYQCENCHWSQQVGGLLPSTDQHYGPGGTLLANHYFDLPGFSLQPLESPDEPGDNGWLYPTAIMSNQGNHHVGGLYRDCTNCHAYEDGYPGPDPNDPLLIRYCGRCHSPASLHAVRAHVEAYDGFDVPGTGWNASGWEAAELSGTPQATVYRPFDQEERCAGCHTVAPIASPPPANELAPYVHSLWPNVGKPGTVVTLSGSSFGQTFSQGSRVQMSVDDLGSEWVDLPPVSWTPTQIAAAVPAAVFPVGNHRLRVITPAGTSNELVFTMTDQGYGLTDAGDEMDPDGLNGDGHTYGPLYSRVTLAGHFIGPEAAAPLSSEPDSAGVYYFTQILLEPVMGGPILTIADPDLRSATPPNPRATLSGKAPAVAWDYDSVTFKLQKFWEDLNGNYACDGLKGEGENMPVPVSEIPPGPYLLKLRRVYWTDWNGNGLFDQPYPLEPSDPANEALLVACSGPADLTISTDPYLRRVKPKPAVAGSRVRLVGINFGDAQADSTVNIYKRDGVTLKTRLTAESRRMRRWSNYRVVFKMLGKPGQVRRLSVTVGGEESNRVRVKLN